MCAMMTHHRRRLRFLVSIHVAVAASAARGQTVALTHANVIDGTGSAIQTNRTIIIDGTRIVAIQPASATIPRGASIRDLSGRYVIPGLIDSHVHLGTQPRPSGVMEQILRATLLGGVTTVRDMGGQYEIVSNMARLGAPDTAPMPRVVYSAIVAGPGMWLDGDRARFFAGASQPGESPTVRRLTQMSDVVPAIAAARRAGASGIKIYNTIEAPLVRAIAAEAHRQGLHVWSHFFVDPNPPSLLIDAGAEVVSHGDQFVAEALTDADRRAPVAEYRAARARAYASPDLVSSSAVRALVAKMKARGVILEPTLTVMRPAPDSAGRIPTPSGLLFHNAVEFTRAAYRGGVELAAGTDALGGSTPNIHLELQLLVDSVGLTPAQAIRAATSINARALGVADSVGTIATGKRADLVVLVKNPLTDIANTQTVVGVMKAGRYHERPRPMGSPAGTRPPAT